MRTIFLSFLHNELSLSLIILILLLLSPLLTKYYKASVRYYMWFVLVIALLVPYHLPTDKAIWEIDILPLMQTLSSFQTQTDKTEVQSTDISLPNEQSSILNDFTNDSTATMYSFINHLPIHATSKNDSTINSINTTPLSYLIFIWLIGIVLFSCFIIFSHLKFMLFSRKWYKPIDDKDLQILIQTLQVKYQLKSNIEVKYCKLLSTPITIGLIKPLILLPCTSFEKDELALLLSHEMIHCNRKDILYKVLITLVQILHWYNPLVHLMKNRIYFECETSCDEKVLFEADADTRMQYGEMIIDIIRQQNLKYSPLSSAFFMGKRKIKERLTNIMNQKLKYEGKILFTFIVALTIFSNVLFGFTTNPITPNTTLISNKSSLGTSGTNIECSDNNLKAHGSIAPHTSALIETLPLKSRESVTYSLTHNIMDLNGQSQSDALTILIIADLNTVSQIQLSNSNPIEAFIATKDSDYLVLLQNNTDKTLVYSFKRSPATGTTSSSIPNSNTSDKNLADYIAKTNDIGMLFTNIDHLNQSTIDSIMIDYIKRTNDIGMLFSAKDNLSQSAIDQIVKNYASNNPDPGMLKTLSPYVSKGVLSAQPTKNPANSNTKKNNTIKSNTNQNNGYANSFCGYDGYNTWMNGIVQMKDFTNQANASDSVSGSFDVSNQEELVIFSTMKSGTLSFDLFSPDNKQVLNINAKEVDQTITLSPGKWTYNYTLNGSNGIALIVARKKSEPIDIVMQNFELHK